MLTADQCGVAQSDAKSWMAQLSGYRQPNMRRSLWELLIAGIPFTLAWTAILMALNLEQFWLYALLIVPAAGLAVLRTAPVRMHALGRQGELGIPRGGTACYSACKFGSDADLVVRC
ncbi:hypothetical protein [Ancylobacter sonchi]|uniref:hypothetical protein n=1 Tax=Ancylobacter sonchi TaxID=1937790 RepID=UPI001BD5AF2D|nr:hypothetical protein [Ancylobacter sonchi]